MITSKQWKTIVLSSLGGGLEYYDFVIFIVFAPYIGKNFSYSAEENAFAQLFFSLALFAIGYLMRPIGGILFSHLGDKVGRKKAFSLSIALMAGSTLLMGLLPSYQTLGIAAPLIFTLLRMIQGISLGGELPGAITFLSEHCPQKIGIACGILFFCVNGGIVLADAVHSLLVYCFTKPILMDWGWRIAFFIGSSLGVLAYYLRKRLEETPAFLELQKEIRIQKVPILTLFKNHLRQVLLVILVFAFFPLSLTLLLLYINSYLSLFPSLSHAQITHIALVNAIIVSCFIFILGYIIDKYLINSHKALKLCAVALFLCAPMVFYYITTFSTAHVGLLLGFLSVIIGCSVISSVVILARSFPTEVRYSGIAFCYNISFGIFAGLSPLAASYLIDKYHMMMAPAYLIQISAVLTLIALWKLFSVRK